MSAVLLIVGLTTVVGSCYVFWVITDKHTKRMDALASERLEWEERNGNVHEV
jgi:hypothetical protein